MLHVGTGRSQYNEAAGIRWKSGPPADTNTCFQIATFSAKCLVNQCYEKENEGTNSHSQTKLVIMMTRLGELGL